MTEIQGQVLGVELDHLKWLAEQVPDGGLIVEIGAYRGLSTSALLQGAGEGVRVVSIDPWYLQSPTPQGYETIETMNLFADRVKSWREKITQIVGWPLDVAQWWDAPIDLLFCDCVKDYETLSAIWAAWLPHCTGWLASHDVKPVYPGVMRVVKETLEPITDRHHHIEWLWSGRIKNNV